jgi:DNA-binding Lrp family transcriptional regulator
MAQTGDALAKLVLIALANRANDDGECWPSLERIAQECETSTRTVIRKIEKLEKLGHIKRVRRAKEGMKTSNLYVLPGKQQGFSVVTESHIDVTESHPRSDTVSPTVVTESHIKHALETPKETHTCERAEKFNDWWARYPRKDDKKIARQRFMKLTSKALDACMADDLESRYRDTEKKYIPLPSTYLNKERWNGEINHGSDSVGDYL